MGPTILEQQNWGLQCRNPAHGRSAREMVTLLMASLNRILTTPYFCKQCNCHRRSIKKWELKNCSSAKFTVLTSRFCCLTPHFEGWVVCMAVGPWSTLRAQVSPVLPHQSKWSCTGANKSVSELHFSIANFQIYIAEFRISWSLLQT